MASNCHGFKVVASPDYDGRSLDFTLAAEQAIFGLIPAGLFLVAGIPRVVYLSKQSVKTVPNLSRNFKLVMDSLPSPLSDARADWFY